MKRKEATQEYKWDFSHLYKNHDEWKKDLNLLVVKTQKYQDFKNKLNQKEVFFEYLRLEEELDFLVNKMSIYLHYADTDATDQSFQELEGLIAHEYQKISVATSFIAPEFKEIGETIIMNFLNSDPKYHPHIYGFKKFFEEAKHLLNAHDEELLSKVGRSMGAVHPIYDSLSTADKHDEKIVYKGKKQILTQSLLTEIYEDTDPIQDQQLRIKASKLYSKNYVDRKHSFTAIYEGILQGSVEDVQLRGYESTLQASLSGDSVPVDIYLKLLEIGKKYNQPFKNYFQLVKNYFQLEKFYVTDRSLKLVEDYKSNFSVEQAKVIIKEALAIMGKDYLQALEVAWSNNKIDYYEDTNKRHGAYSSGGSGLDPIILMNWDDKLGSVNTLAHEIGHSVHTIFADQNQPYPLNDYPIILAEVASTINEHLLFEYMFKNAKNKQDKIYLLQHRIQDLLGTFTTQIQYSAFEYQAHKLVENGQPLTADILGKIFVKTQQEYGHDVFDQKPNAKGIGYGWPYISHFFHSPYYVYKYAIDVVASYKLYTDIKSGNVETTLNFLKAGGHKEPMKIMFDSGIDFTKEETYLPLIRALEEHIEELTILLKK
ncbi:oligoendopeptidase F [Williamsoniiplasma luminosum]|uniref:Oligopeptidase F n=1 Tax=Williamsoniiplasma luminosum TaxID=214888 RepID=A0A2S0NKW5_9MOLU|nr:oligoendopeptidase F [Williamsoniiplasma luminosum]AVP49656.1 MAG: oligoendopeptidase F [Williamsoniiplasma luminosum]